MSLKKLAAKKEKKCGKYIPHSYKIKLYLLPKHMHHT